MLLVLIPPFAVAGAVFLFIAFMHAAANQKTPEFDSSLHAPTRAQSSHRIREQSRIIPSTKGSIKVRALGCTPQYTGQLQVITLHPGKAHELPTWVSPQQLRYYCGAGATAGGVL